MSTPDPQPPILRSPEPIDWKPDTGTVAQPPYCPRCGGYHFPSTSVLCPVKVGWGLGLNDLSKAIGEFDAEFPKVEFDVGHIAAAYERGRREERERCARIIEDADANTLDIHELARAIRAEADTPGTAPP